MKLSFTAVPVSPYQEDQQEIIRTLSQYARAMGFGRDEHIWVGCFTEDGVWFSTVDAKWSGRRGIRLEGREELGRWFMKSGRDKPGWADSHPVHKHMYAALDIRVDGDRATATS